MDMRHTLSVFYIVYGYDNGHASHVVCNLHGVRIRVLDMRHTLSVIYI